MWNLRPGWYMVTGLEQQWQCRDSPTALLPRAAAPDDSMVVITPNKARSPDVTGKGARMPHTVQESCLTQRMCDNIELRYCSAFCPCCCSMGYLNHIGHLLVTVVCSSLLSLAQPGLSQQTWCWGITFTVAFLLQRQQRWAGGASLSKLDGLCQGWWIALLVEVGYTSS